MLWCPESPGTGQEGVSIPPRGQHLPAWEQPPGANDHLPSSGALKQPAVVPTAEPSEGTGRALPASMASDLLSLLVAPQLSGSEQPEAGALPYSPLGLCPVCALLFGQGVCSAKGYQGLSVMCSDLISGNLARALETRFRSPCPESVLGV